MRQLSKEEKNQQKIRELLIKSSAVEVYKMVLSGIIKQFPAGFWSMPENYDYARECTKYMIEEILKWDKETVVKKINTKQFKKCKLGGMLDRVFGGSPIYAITNAYPEYHVWEFNSVPNGYWTLDTMREAVRWIFIDKLKMSKEEIINNFTLEILRKNGLRGVQYTVYENNMQLIDLINLCFDFDVKPWELNSVPDGYWTTETRGLALRWLIEEKLNWSREDICKKFNYNVLRENGLRSISLDIQNNRSYNLYDLIEMAYCGEFNPWDLNNGAKYYWNSDTRVRALKWLIEKKLKWTREEVCEKLSKHTLEEYNLRAITYVKSGNKSKYIHIYSTLDKAYPNENYKIWELKGSRLPNKYWQEEEHRIDAVIWLAKKLNKKACELNKQDFLDNRLKGLIEYSQEYKELIEEFNRYNKK